MKKVYFNNQRIMIEKKTMGYYDMKYPNYEARAVMVMVDSETGKIEVYRYNDEWYDSTDTDRFFNTVEDAEKSCKEFINYLVDRIPEVKSYLESIANLTPPEDEDNPLYFDKSDIVPYQLRTEKNTYYKDTSEYYEQRMNMLMSYVQTGFLNICGTNIRKDDVVRVYWGKKSAELHTKDERTIVTKSKKEYWLVGVLFGKNDSGYTLTRLNDKKEGEE